ncbi:hypothetical protein [Nocardia yamanashiensis]|uniref:hypothetical protein n=1 Tax=Nocardia yamanashiensis TaxID=209247 RepID=UPI0008348B9E|nr:hypothetical protein [Nocardia yamanashiensis]
MEKTAKQRSWRDRSIVVTGRRRLATGIAAAVLLGGTGSALGYFAYEHGRAADQVVAARALAADRDSAAKAGSEFLTTMFTVNSGSLEHWDSAVLAGTTDSMHAQLAQWKTVLQKLVSANMEMSSTVKDVGVVSQAGDAVTLLAVIESTGRTSPDSAAPNITTSSALIDLRQIDGKWKVQGYGPAGGMPPAAPATSPAPTPDQTPR